MRGGGDPFSRGSAKVEFRASCIVVQRFRRTYSEVQTQRRSTSLTNDVSVCSSLCVTSRGAMRSQKLRVLSGTVKTEPPYRGEPLSL